MGEAMAVRLLEKAGAQGGLHTNGGDQDGLCPAGERA
jgi:hypothetical protein